MLFHKTDKIRTLVGNHTDAVITCYDKFEEAMIAVVGGCDREALAVYTEELRALESNADKIRRQIIRQLLEGGLVMDSRKSVMHVIESVDGIADIAEDIIQEIYIQRMALPDICHESMLAMVRVTKRQLTLLIDIVKNIVDRYNEREMTQVTSEIEHLESEVDDLQHDLTERVFDESWPLAEKLQLKKIIEMTGEIADLIEDISDEIEIVMLARKV